MRHTKYARHFNVTSVTTEWHAGIVATTYDVSVARNNAATARFYSDRLDNVHIDGGILPRRPLFLNRTAPVCVVIRVLED